MQQPVHPYFKNFALFDSPRFIDIKQRLKAEIINELERYIEADVNNNDESNRLEEAKD